MELSSDIDVEQGRVPNASPRSAQDMRMCGLGWRGLGFSVTGQRGVEPKAIMSDVDGLVRHGELLFIMGPSGAAKSSTLDALARRVKHTVRGDVWVDGRPAGPGEFRERAKYVEQQDCLYEVLSAHETIQYAAEFQVADKVERAPRVEEVLKRLGLESARDTKVGGTFFRGLSGGQLRRVAIGVELVAKPEVLLLDEPTSGLDSSAAVQVVALLREIARSGVAVVCTIHQPSQKVFEMSDKLLLLAKGKTMYFGETRGATEYFQQRGFAMPENTSVPEYLLETINTDFHASADDHEKLVSEWKSSRAYEDLGNEISEWVRQEDESEGRGKKLADNTTFKRSFVTETLLHASRNSKDALRNPSVVYLRAAMYIALAFMIGVAWWRVPARADRIEHLLGCLFFACAFFIFMSISVLPVYLNERRIVTRERMNGSYRVVSYILGHFVVEAVMLAMLSLIVTALIYPMVNLHPSVGRAFFFAFTMWVSLLVAESIMILISAVVPMFIVGIAIGAFLFGTFMVVQGFFARIQFIPWPLRWLQYVGFHTYSFAAMCINEFDGRVYDAVPDGFPAFPEAVDGSAVIQSLEFPLNNKWDNIAVLFLNVIVYRLAALVWISVFHKGKK